MKSQVLATYIVLAFASGSVHAVVMPEAEGGQRPGRCVLQLQLDGWPPDILISL